MAGYGPAAWVGYVGVPKGHPAWLKGDELNVDVHGGITYADGMPPLAAQVTEPTWWIGFDCAHAGDALPRFYVQEGRRWRRADVVAETNRLADQLADMAAITR